MTLERKDVTKRIKNALYKKTGIRFSVTGSTGTAYDWITIMSPKANRVKNVLVSKGLDYHDDVYEQVASPDGYYMSSADQDILKNALGIDYNYNMQQGLSFDYSDWSYWLEQAEKANPFEKEIEEVEEVEEVIYDIPEIENETITLEAWQIQDITDEDITAKAKNGEFTQIKFPRYNKQDWLVDYTKQLESPEDYSIEKCVIEKKILLTQVQYDQYVWSLLSYQRDWLGGLGGSNSLNIDNLPENTQTWGSNDWDTFKEGAYNLVVLVEAFQREPLFVNPEGHDYARYVGFASSYISDTNFNINGNLSVTAIELEVVEAVTGKSVDIEIDEVIVNPMVTLAVKFLQSGKSYGEVLNILADMLGIAAALDMVKDAMVVFQA